MIAALSLPICLSVRDGSVELRRATPHDLRPIMRLLSDDPISAGRSDVNDLADEATYASALGRIIDDPSNELVVAVDGAGQLIGTLQLTVIPGMARRGALRLLVEAVRVAADQRSRGIGGAMMRWVTEVAAPAVGAGLVQLTSDSARADAHRFYLRLGFVDSHVGFKYAVPAQAAAPRLSSRA